MIHCSLGCNVFVRVAGDNKSAGNKFEIGLNRKYVHDEMLYNGRNVDRSECEVEYFKDQSEFTDSGSDF